MCFAFILQVTDGERLHQILCVINGHKEMCQMDLYFLVSSVCLHHSVCVKNVHKEMCQLNLYFLETRK